MSRFEGKQNMPFEVSVLLKQAGISFVEEHRFCDRRWKFDFAVPSKMIAIECEGMTGGDKHGIGGHRTMSGYVKDVEKYNRAAQDGWTVIRVIPDWAWGRLGNRGKNPCGTVAAVDYVKNAPEVVK